MSRALGRWWLTGFGVALLSWGCATDAGAPARGPIALHALADASGFAPIWANRDLTPIGQPIAVGAMVVGIAGDGAKLVVAGIDAATGVVRWRQPITPGAVTPGVSIRVAAIGNDRVAFFSPTTDSFALAQLVVADARTGAELARSPPVLFDAMPYACRNGKDACAVSHAASGRVWQYRLEVASNRYIKESESFRSGTRLLESPSLLDLGDRPENSLGWLAGGKLRWGIPASAAFPAGFSSDNGWRWHRFADQGVVVGSLYGAPVTAGARFLHDLGNRAATAGLSEATGQVLWRDRGSSLDCRFDPAGYPVRCRMRGHMWSQPRTDPMFEDLDVTVEGFDPVTGNTTWSVPAGAAKGLATPQASLAIAGPTQVVLDGPEGAIVLDYATGATRVSPPGAAYWCMVHVEYEGIWSYSTSWDGARHNERPGGEVAAMCDAQGHPSSELPSAEATMAAGAHAGNYAVIAGRQGYVGFRLR